MLSNESTVLTTLHRVQQFMTNHAGELGDLNTSRSRQALDDLEAQLSSFAASQTGARSVTRTAVARQKVLKNTLLVKHLRPISAIAEAQLDQAPDFTELKLPRNIRTTPQLLAVAAAMAAAAVKYTHTFVEAGMSSTFVADLQAAADAVKNNVTSKGTARSSQIGATNGLKVATRQAHRIVKQIDALIEARLAGNTALLAQWKATKRFTGRAQPVAKTTASAAATVAVAPEPAPAVTAPGVVVPVVVAVSAVPSAPTTAPAAASSAADVDAGGKR
jgi:hypothetical protein